MCNLSQKKSFGCSEQKYNEQTKDFTFYMWGDTYNFRYRDDSQNEQQQVPCNEKTYAHEPQQPASVLARAVE